MVLRLLRKKNEDELEKTDLKAEVQDLQSAVHHLQKDKFPTKETFEVYQKNIRREEGMREYHEQRAKNAEIYQAKREAKYASLVKAEVGRHIRPFFVMSDNTGRSAIPVKKYPPVCPHCGSADLADTETFLRKAVQTYFAFSKDAGLVGSPAWPSAVMGWYRCHECEKSGGFITQVIL